MPADARDTPTWRVVLCDDQHDYVRLLSMLLSLEPDLDIVGTAGDGIEAIDACKQLQPDVLLLDVSMPNMDGIAALPHVRQASPRTRVLMLSGFSSPQIRQRSIEAGASGFIEKGTPMTELPRLVRDTLISVGITTP
jgi:DNA-binding NarL/FixJ family response regulator